METRTVLKTETLVDINTLSGVHIVMDQNNVIVSSSELAQKVESLNIGMNFLEIPQVLAYKNKLIPLLASVREGESRSLFQRSVTGNRLYRWDFNGIDVGLRNPGCIHVQRIIAKDSAEIRRDHLRSVAKEQAGIGIWEVDLIKNCIYWDDVTRRIHEVPDDFKPDFSSGIDFYKEGADRKRIIALFNECATFGKPYDADFVIISAKGREIHVNAKGSAEFRDGKCIRVIGTFQDITERKRIEQALRNSEAKLSSAIDNTLISFFIVDADTYQITSFNKAARKTFGYTKAELQNLDIRAIECSGNDSFFRKLTATGGSSEFTAILCHKLGAHIEAKVFLSTLCNTEGQPESYLLQIEDITELAANRRHLDKLNRIMKKQNERLLNFAQIVSHNLRSHTTNITMLTEFLNAEKEANGQQEIIELIREASATLKSTITDLNKVTSLDRDEVQQEICDLGKVINKAKTSAIAAMSLQDFQIKNNIGPCVKVRATAAYLDSIFFNLITNAVKYRRQIPDSFVNFSATSENGYVTICVQDNGLGIDLQRHRHKIFGLYKTFHGNEDAQGLGLYMTKGQIDLMGGSITVESTPNEGTTFIITLEAAD